MRIRTHSLLTICALAALLAGCVQFPDGMESQLNPQDYPPLPTIGVSHTDLTVSCVQGGSPAPTSFEVFNSGSGTLGFMISDDVDWLTCTPTAGASTGPTSRTAVTVTFSTGFLPAGTHGGTIFVTGADTVAVAVTLTVEGGTPEVAVDRTSISTSCAEGGNPAPSSFEVYNTGTGLLEFTVTDDVAWLSCSPATGSSSDAANRIGVTVTYDAAGLAAGTHTGTISVAGPNTATIAVTLTVNAASAPTVSVSTNTLSASCTEGGSPADGFFEVYNGGSGTLNFTVTDDVGWLDCTPTSGSSTGDADRSTVTVAYNTAGLAAGSHSATISVDGAGTQTISVSLTVNPAATPVADVSTNAITVSCVQGGSPAPASFEVFNSGVGTLNFTVSENTSWLAVTPTSGTSVGSGDRKAVTITFTASSLMPGTFDGSVTVAGGGTQTVSVTLTVTPDTTPAVGLSENAVSVTTDEGLNPGMSGFDVYNDGAGVLSFTISDNAAWLECNPTSGTSTGSSDRVPITITYNASALGAGSYTGSITVGGGGTQTFTVNLTVNSVSTPSVGLNTTSLSASCFEGSSPADKSFTVHNSGAGTLNFTISDDVNWLECAPLSGSSTGSGDQQVITVGLVNAASLTPGAYTGTITVTGDDTRTVTVTLTVNAAVAAPFDAGQRFGFTGGYHDHDGVDTVSTIFWRMRDPWASDATSTNYWGDIVLDTDFGGSAGTVPGVNPSDTTLIAYKLTPAQEGAFVTNDGTFPTFWEADWSGRDYAQVIPSTHCYPERCGFTDDSDASMIIKAAGGSAGLYVLAVVTDNMWVSKPGGGDDWMYDCVHLYTDARSSEEILSCSDCLVGLYNSSLTYSSARYEVWMGDMSPPDNWTYGYYDDNLWSWQTLGLTWSSGESQFGIRGEVVHIDANTRAVEMLIPWGLLGAP